MPHRPGPCRAWLRRGLVLALWGLSTAALAGECRLAFDLGSSGIRTGASNSARTARADIDYLTPLWAGRGLDETLAPTAAALRDLPRQAGLDSGCAAVGGGFSAWRLAAGQGSHALAVQLADIQAASGVPVLVIPQRQEGAYGYFGARAALGERLTTSHILDIGGGSLQVAGPQTSYGEALGQKIWHRRLCAALHPDEASPCTLQALTAAELARARTLTADALSGVAPALGTAPVTMTAISRPVSRGVLPAVNRLLGHPADRWRLTRADLAVAIERLAGQSLTATAAAVGSTPAYARYLLSDMLLVEGLLAATAGDELAVAETDLTNLPGLLADDRAYRWAERYACYLERLGEQGAEAYASDPETCPPPAR